MVIVYKISKFIHILDIHTMQTYEVDQVTYWKNPFKALFGRERLTEFIVMDIENIDTNMNDSRAALKQKFKQVRVQIARATDLGVNEITYTVNCHLGEILNYNDTVLAYDLEEASSPHLDEFLQNTKRTIPEIVIIKKAYPRYRKKAKKRNWKLKHMTKKEEAEDAGETQDKKAAKKNRHNNLEARQAKDHQKDYEMFLQDLEEDPEFRSQINIYEEGSIKEVQKMDEQFQKEAQEEDDDWESVEEMPGVT